MSLRYLHQGGCRQVSLLWKHDIILLNDAIVSIWTVCLSCRFGPRTNFLQALGSDCSGTENSLEDCDLVGAICSPSDTIGIECTTVNSGEILVSGTVSIVVNCLLLLYWIVFLVA